MNQTSDSIRTLFDGLLANMRNDALNCAPSKQQLKKKFQFGVYNIHQIIRPHANHVIYVVSEGLKLHGTLNISNNQYRIVGPITDEDREKFIDVLLQCQEIDTWRQRAGNPEKTMLWSPPKDADLTNVVPIFAPR